MRLYSGNFMAPASCYCIDKHVALECINKGLYEHISHSLCTKFTVPDGTKRHRFIDAFYS